MKYILFALLTAFITWFVTKPNKTEMSDIAVLDGKIEITFRDDVTRNQVNEFLDSEKFEIEKMTFKTFGLSVQFNETDAAKVKKMLDTSAFIVDYRELNFFSGMKRDTTNLTPEKKKILKDIQSVRSPLSFWIYFTDSVNEDKARELINPFNLKLVLQVFKPEKSVIVRIEDSKKMEIVKRVSKNSIVEFTAFIADKGILPVVK